MEPKLSRKASQWWLFLPHLHRLTLKFKCNLKSNIKFNHKAKSNM